MAKDITEKTNTRSNNQPQHLDTGQLEYSVNRLFTYGTLSFVAITLGVTYLYLLIQKIKN